MCRVPHIHLVKIEKCPKCHGEFPAVQDCDECNGTGIVEIWREKEDAPQKVIAE